MLGYLLSKMAAFQKNKTNKNILQELANKNSCKCLSHCYCGMSRGLHVVGEVVVIGGGEAPPPPFLH